MGAFIPSVERKTMVVAKKDMVANLGVGKTDGTENLRNKGENMSVGMKCRTKQIHQEKNTIRKFFVAVVNVKNGRVPCGLPVDSDSDELPARYNNTYSSSILPKVVYHQTNLALHIEALVKPRAEDQEAASKPAANVLKAFAGYVACCCIVAANMPLIKGDT
ncbi:hypothetical protein BDV93DRAFT_513795 [Ceratobasidium sp. AG-I]|nr:hypothetical protein BDV93DRAFT_513795 [Ceratobasidium sp. AG-I]